MGLRIKIYWRSRRAIKMDKYFKLSREDRRMLVVKDCYKTLKYNKYKEKSEVGEWVFSTLDDVIGVELRIPKATNTRDMAYDIFIKAVREEFYGKVN